MKVDGPRPTILLGNYQGREAAALVVKGRLQDLLIDSDDIRPGTIYRAITDRPVKGLGGMFLKTPDGPAFLRQSKGLAPGKPVLVQVTGYAEPGKAVPVTRTLTFKSRYVIVTPEAPGLNISRQIKDDDRRDQLHLLAKAEMGDSEMGLILRSACATANDDEIAEDLRIMHELARAVLADGEGNDPEKLTEGEGPHDLAWREWTDPADVETSQDCFDVHEIDEEIRALREIDVPMDAGSLTIEVTRALVAIDVNTGGNTSPAATLRANLAAAQELPRQLRLRGLGGQIVIDPAPMPQRDRKQFEMSLRAAFRPDPVDTALVGWTKMGLFELHRKRQRSPLV